MLPLVGCPMELKLKSAGVLGFVPLLFRVSRYSVLTGGTLNVHGASCVVHHEVMQEVMQQVMQQVCSKFALGLP